MVDRTTVFVMGRPVLVVTPGAWCDPRQLALALGDRNDSVDACEVRDSAIPEALTLYIEQPVRGEGAPQVAFHSTVDGFSLEGPLGRATVDVVRCRGILEPRDDLAVALAVTVMRHVVTRWVMSAGGVVLHAAVIIEDSEGIVVAGPSGTGKTTFARRGRPRPVLSDEMALIVPDPGQVGRTVALRPPPWGGEQAGVEKLQLVPVGALAILKQGEVDRWRPLSRARVFSSVAQFVPGGPNPLDLIRRLQGLFVNTSVGEIVFRLHGDVGHILAAVLRGRSAGGE